MYTPDRVFMQDLKRLDPKLGCYYEENHHHFVITYKRPIGEEVPLMMVKDENNGFRHPDRREIETLKASDTQRVPMESRLKKSAKYMEAEREKSRKKARDDIRDHTKEDRRQLAPKFARLTNTGKFNSTFRRIDLKPKGISAEKIKFKSKRKLSEDSLRTA